MKLAPHEIATPLWGKLVEHHQATLTKFRARLENPRIEEPERRELAWRIHTIKEFLALAEPERER
jgi:hypothetical protein